MQTPRSDPGGLLVCLAREPVKSRKSCPGDGPILLTASCRIQGK